MKADRKPLSSGSRPALGDIVERVQQISAENEKLVRQLADGEYRFRRLAKAVWQVQEEERRNIALDLHDGIGQVLTALINQMKHAAGDAAASDESVALAKSALDEVRRLSRALRPSVLDDLGLGPALQWLTRTTSEASGLKVALQLPDDEIAVDKQTETLVFRVVQEALTNIVKHAGAVRARIEVEVRNEKLEVAIVDNGRGFDADAALGAADKGFGLRGMRDRVELFGGRLDIRSGPDEGTLIAMALPKTPQ